MLPEVEHLRTLVNSLRIAGFCLFAMPVFRPNKGHAIFRVALRCCFVPKSSANRSGGHLSSGPSLRKMPGRSAQLTVGKSTRSSSTPSSAHRFGGFGAVSRPDELAQSPVAEPNRTQPLV
jgi:hypothetical protein